MEEVIISTSRTERGYSGSCELLPGWVVSFSGIFSCFIDYVKESIDFYVDCAKEDDAGKSSMRCMRWEGSYRRFACDVFPDEADSLAFTSKKPSLAYNQTK